MRFDERKEDTRYLATWMPVSDEAIVDFAMGSEADQAAAAARLQRDAEKMERRWRSLPRHVRLSRTVRGWYWEQRERFLSWLHRSLFPECERP